MVLRARMNRHNNLSVDAVAADHVAEVDSLLITFQGLVMVGTSSECCVDVAAVDDNNLHAVVPASAADTCSWSRSVCCTRSFLFQQAIQQTLCLN